MILDNLETSKWEGRGLLGLQIDKISRTDGSLSGSVDHAQLLRDQTVQALSWDSVAVSNKDYLVS